MATNDSVEVPEQLDIRARIAALNSASKSSTASPRPSEGQPGQGGRARPLPTPKADVPGSSNASNAALHLASDSQGSETEVRETEAPSPGVRELLNRFGGAAGGAPREASSTGNRPPSPYQTRPDGEGDLDKPAPVVPPRPTQSTPEVVPAPSMKPDAILKPPSARPPAPTPRSVPSSPRPANGRAAAAQVDEAPRAPPVPLARPERTTLVPHTTRPANLMPETAEQPPVLPPRRGAGSSLNPHHQPKSSSDGNLDIPNLARATPSVAPPRSRPRASAGQANDVGRGGQGGGTTPQLPPRKARRGSDPSISTAATSDAAAAAPLASGLLPPPPSRNRVGPAATSTPSSSSSRNASPAGQLGAPTSRGSIGTRGGPVPSGSRVGSSVAVAAPTTTTTTTTTAARPVVDATAVGTGQGLQFGMDEAQRRRYLELWRSELQKVERRRQGAAARRPPGSVQPKGRNGVGAATGRAAHARASGVDERGSGEEGGEKPMSVRERMQALQIASSTGAASASIPAAADGVGTTATTGRVAPTSTSVAEERSAAAEVPRDAAVVEARLPARRVARLWRRSRLPDELLARIWDEAVRRPASTTGGEAQAAAAGRTSVGASGVDEQSFLRGLAAIDAQLALLRTASRGRGRAGLANIGGTTTTTTTTARARGSLGGGGGAGGGGSGGGGGGSAPTPRASVAAG